MTVYVVATALSMLLATVAGRLEAAGGTDMPSHFSVGLFRFLAFAPLTLVAALRYEVGTDWPIYSSHFTTINTGGEAFKEWGFNLLNRVVYLFTDNYSVMAAAVAVLSLALVYRAIFAQSDNYAVSVLFFVLSAMYFTMLNQQRQMLAIAVFVYAYRHVRARRLAPYLLLSAAAFLLHTSAVIMLPIYALYAIRINLRAQLLILCASGVLWYPCSKAVLFLVSKTSYGWYLDSLYESSFYKLGFVFALLTLAFCYLLYLSGEELEDPDCEMTLKMTWLSVIVLLFSATIPQISRVNGYFTSILFLTLPALLLRERRHLRRLCYLLFAVGLFGAKLLYDVYVNGWYDVIPYRTLFAK